MQILSFDHASAGLVVESRPDPEPGPGEVIVKVGRCGICGSDLHMAKGHLGGFGDGVVPGHEFAGEVVALGSGVSKLKTGDRVSVLPLITCGQCADCLAGDPVGCRRGRMMGVREIDGGYAQYAIADANWCVKLPESLSLADGALVEPLAVSLRAVRAARIAPGDRVLVMGAGPIGAAAAWWARLAGAGKVAVSATSLRRKDIAGAMGADAFIIPEDGRELADQAREALGGPVDLVIECAGAPGSLQQAVSAIRRGGMVVAPGFCWTPDTFMAVGALVNEATIKYTNMYDRREFEIAVDQLSAGRVEPRAMISRQVGLGDAPAVFAELLAGASDCKVMIAPNG